MERAERIILLCLGLLIPVLLVPILWLMLVLTAVTAVQRFVRVWNQANAATVVLERQAARRQRRIARRSARSRRWSELRAATAASRRICDPAVLRTRDEGIEHIGLAGYKAAAALARYVPEPLYAGAATAVGVAFSQAMRQRRAVVARNLTRIDPTLRGARLERMIRATFDSYARYWMESFRLPYLSPAEVDAGFAYHGYGQIPEILAQGRGLHPGPARTSAGWEWAGRWIVDQGHQITVVVEPIEPPELFDFFVDFRKSLGMNVDRPRSGRRRRRS